MALSAAALAAVLAVTTFLATRSTAAPDLPAISAEQLVTKTLTTLEHNGPIHGDAQVHLDLGLPSLPTADYGTPEGPAQVLGELSGDHSLRVWKSADGFRLAELLPAAERDVYASRATGVWLWDSTEMTAYRVTGPAQHEAHGEPPRMDPTSLANKSLQAITETTNVSVGTARSVAGRDAYALVLEPKTADTLVGKVEIDIDAETFHPLRAAIYARGATTPAIESTYTNVSYASIDPSTFEFTPPPGAHVATTPEGRGLSPANDQHDRVAPTDARALGHDWTSMAAVRIEKTSHENYQLNELFDLLPYSGPLLSARLVPRANHFWIVMGMVPQSVLERVEPRLP